MNERGDLGIRPIYHQLEHRVDAHILVAFLAYCLIVTLKHRVGQYARGLTPRAVLEKLGSIHMLDLILSTTDGRRLVCPATPNSKPISPCCSITSTSPCLLNRLRASASPSRKTAPH